MGLRNLKLNLNGQIESGERVITPFAVEVAELQALAQDASFEFARSLVRKQLAAYYEKNRGNAKQTRRFDLVINLPATNLPNSESTVPVELHLTVRGDGYASADLAMYDHSKAQWRKEDVADQLDVTFKVQDLGGRTGLQTLATAARLPVDSRLDDFVSSLLALGFTHIQ